MHVLFITKGRQRTKCCCAQQERKTKTVLFHFFFFLFLLLQSGVNEKQTINTDKMSTIPFNLSCFYYVNVLVAIKMNVDDVVVRVS